MRITSGSLKNRPLLSPKDAATRPTSEKLRQALFNICRKEIVDAQFLDLFAGSGAMGIEALSNGAAHATFVDQSKHAIACIRKNIHNLDLSSLTTIIQGEALTVLKKLEKQGKVFDIIYIDPPYAYKRKKKEVLLFLDSSSLLSSHSLLFLEDRYTAEESPLSLQNLSLHSKRKFGSSSLYQYMKSITPLCG